MAAATVHACATWRKVGAETNRKQGCEGTHRDGRKKRGWKGKNARHGRVQAVHSPQDHVALEDVRAPVQDEMKVLEEELRAVVGNRHPMLLSAADQIFGAGGKKLRPMLVLLVANAVRKRCETSEHGDVAEKQRSLAQITEMIHTASLVHDDVLDECDLRRGRNTVNSLYGTRVAVLVGDFLFAQSSWALAQLENLEVIKLISQVIADFADGEISQAQNLFDCDMKLETYLAKSFYKTASLIAASCRGAAALCDASEEVKQAMFQYGKHVGLAFQIVDDILDFTQSTKLLGKPQGQDLASGNLTAPTLFALKNEAQLRVLIEREFQEEGDIEKAIELVRVGGGISGAQRLAREEGQLALEALECLPECEAKESLELVVEYILERLF